MAIRSVTAPDFTLERAALEGGARLVAGVDEAGRGPLAGPVVAAAVILNPEHIPAGLNDSKKLSEQARNALECRKNRAQSVTGITLGLGIHKSLIYNEFARFLARDCCPGLGGER